MSQSERDSEQGSDYQLLTPNARCGNYGNPQYCARKGVKYSIVNSITYKSRFAKSIIATIHRSFYPEDLSTGSNPKS